MIHVAIASTIPVPVSTPTRTPAAITMETTPTMLGAVRDDLRGLFLDATEVDDEREGPLPP